MVQPVEPRVHREVLPHREAVPQSGRLGQEADAAGADATPSAGAIGSPSTSTRPDDGAMSPASMRSVVVLPAPFGPSSAKISPGGQLERHVLTATRSPNDLSGAALSTMLATLP